MEDKVIKFYPSEIKKLENKVENIKEDIALLKVNSNADNSFEKVIIDGKTYTERKDAGEKIIEICKGKTNKDEVEIGEYKGFKLMLSFDTLDRKFHIGIKNKLSYDVELGSDPSGNIIRIDNTLNAIEKRLENTISNLEDTRKNYELAKEEIKRPFPQEEELKEKSKRLDELNIKLNLNEKDKELIDDGASDRDDSQECKKDYER